MFTTEKITSDSGLKSTSLLAEEIWREHFHGIISDSQIEYMLEKFQSYSAMKRQTEEEGYEYYAMRVDGVQAGYFGICEKPDKTLFLSKLYLKKEFRGNGYASAAFEKIKEIGRSRGDSMVWLTVNKHNDSTIAVYRHWGMEVIREEVTDIGEGFVMDDYVFAIRL